MAEQGRVPEQSYRAFISYSHRDDVAARALHRRLETYRLPRHLIGSDTARGAVPQRLTPIFRDLDELSAADDLSVEIKAALARSEVLIIVASPAAKASKWVNLEIETFRALHGAARPVLVALIEGEPADAFPPALTAGGLEPVAADFRKSAAGGKRLALLKLVAGITAAPLDALVQRDAQRQYRRVMAITGSALAAVLVMALLLVVALRSQAEAQRQRQEAEGLVEYMLTDLRDKLKGVGRLDVMTAVNERAMKYYGGQDDLDDLSAESLNRRAAILQAMGEDEEKRGDLKLALEKFVEAHRATLASLSQNPDDADRIFAHAQSEYWIGYAAWQTKDRQTAFQHWDRYLGLAKKLDSLEPNTKRSQMELGYANGNLCDLYLWDNFDLQRALNFCMKSVEHVSIAVSKKPSDKEIRKTLANRYGWLANVFLQSKMISEALHQRSKEREILSELLSEYPNNFDLETRYIWSEHGSGAAWTVAGRNDMASFHLKSAFARVNRLVEISADDTSLLEMRIKTCALLAQNQRAEGDVKWKKYIALAHADLGRLRKSQFKKTNPLFISDFVDKIEKDIYK